jgi:hypothetical protein
MRTGVTADSVGLSVWPLRCIHQPRMGNFNAAWLASEHHRLHHVEQWPDSPRKQAVVEAIRSSLGSLSAYPRNSQESFICFLCEARKTKSNVLEMRPTREPLPVLTGSTELERAG